MNIFFLLLWTLSISFAKGQIPTGNVSSKCSVIIRDVVLVLDASQSISETDFQLAKQFITRMITCLRALNNQNRIALVVFGDSADIVFDFSKYDSIDGMIKNVDAIKNPNGLTAIGKALNLTWVELFPTMRTDAEKLILLLTDGTNNKYPAPYIYADKLKTAGVKIMTLGIGSDINKKELDALATKGLLVLFDSFTDLLIDKNRLIEEICPITEPGLKACENHELKFVILMPVSWTLSDFIFEKEKNFIIKLLEKFNPACDTGRIGIMLFTSRIEVFRIYPILDIEELIFEHFVRAGDINDIYHAMNNIQDHKDIFGYKGPHHWIKGEYEDGIPYQILLISAGTNIINENTFKIADEYKAKGKKIITVGIGSEYYSTEMKALSSNGKFLVANSTHEIDEISEIVYKMITSGH